VSKVITLIVFLTVTVLLFVFSGTLEGGSYLLESIGIDDPANIANTSFWGLLATMGALSVVGAIVGAIVTRSLQGILFFSVGAGMIPILRAMFMDLILVFNQLRNVNDALAIILIAPILVVIVFIIYDWIRGRD